MFLAGVARSGLVVVNTGRTIGAALVVFHLHVLYFVLLFSMLVNTLYALE